MQITISLEPKDPRKFETVLLELARIPLRMKPKQISNLEKIILEGFELNFEEEQAAGVRWPSLAPWTLAEREEEGFP